MATAAKTRRWFRFRLRSLLLAITAVAIPLAWVANERRQSAQEALIAEELRELGFEYIVFAGRCDWQDSTELRFDGKPHAGWRKFARQLLGDRIVDVSPHNPWDQDSSGFVVEPTYPWADVSRELDLAPFAKLTCLETADFSNLPVSDLTPLAGLKNLKRIYLDSTRVSNLGPLARLTNLEEISFNNTPVRDVSPLANLTRLRRLVANQSLVSDLAPLAKLTRLQSLSLCDTPVADLPPFAKLKNLRYLYLGDSEPWGLEFSPRQTWGGTFNFDINGGTDVYDTAASIFWGGDNYYYYLLLSRVADSRRRAARRANTASCAPHHVSPSRRHHSFGLAQEPDGASSSQYFGQRRLLPGQVTKAASVAARRNAGHNAASQRIANGAARSDHWPQSIALTGADRNHGGCNPIASIARSITGDVGLKRAKMKKTLLAAIIILLGHSACAAEELVKDAAFFVPAMKNLAGQSPRVDFVHWVRDDVICCGHPGFAHRYNLATRRLIWSAPAGNPSQRGSVAVSNKRLYAMGSNGALQAFALANGQHEWSATPTQLAQRAGMASLNPTHIGFIPGTNRLLITAFAKEYGPNGYLFDGALQKVGQVKTDGFVAQITTDPTGRFIVTLSITNNIRIWDTKTSKEIFKFEEDRNELVMDAPFFSNAQFDGHRTLVYTEDNSWATGTVFVHDIVDNKELAHFDSRHGHVVMDVDFPHQHIAVAGTNRRLMVLDFAGKVVADQETISPDRNMAVAFSENGERLAVGSQDGSLRVFRLTNGER